MKEGGFPPPQYHLEDHRGHVGTETGIVEKTIRSTERCDGNILIPEILLGDALNLLGGDGIDVSLDFSGSVSFAGGDQLSANLWQVASQSSQVNQVNVRREEKRDARPRRWRWYRQDPTTRKP